MNKALAEIKKMASALQAVTGAAKKTSSDLQKLAKDKSGADKDKYSAAASAAANIGETAAVALKNVQ
jgi:hypothetical protein